MKMVAVEMEINVQFGEKEDKEAKITLNFLGG